MKSRKSEKRLFSAVLAATMALSCTACGAAGANSGAVLDPKNPTAITLWNYYNGDQLVAFESLVSEFNSTVGIEKGITVISVSQGSIDNLSDSLTNSAAGKVGAQDLPTLAAIYAETAYILEQQGLLTDLDGYFTAEELEAYVPGFIEEGRLTENGPLYLFPVSKSTECFAVNTTDWADFEAATGISPESITDCETLTAAAKAYYDYTDALTPDVADDGKILYGRDSVANYVYIGARQLGHDIFTVSSDGKLTVDLDRDTFKTLWDNYYIPFINGYFGADANYRSEDMKTGTVLAVTGSTSGVSYLPTAVTDENDASHDIDLLVKRPLYFAKGQEVAVQQGAGYCVFKGTEAQQTAAAEFLRWFTESERNLQFSAGSGYSPVTKAANNAEAIKANFATAGESAKETNILNALLVSADVYLNVPTYSNRPFEGSREVRNILGYALEDVAKADRATVVAAMAEGQSREEAVAPFSTDEYFDTWFDTLTADVENTVG